MCPPGPGPSCVSDSSILACVHASRRWTTSSMSHVLFTCRTVRKHPSVIWSQYHIVVQTNVLKFSMYMDYYIYIYIYIHILWYICICMCAYIYVYIYIYTYIYIYIYIHKGFRKCCSPVVASTGSPCLTIHIYTYIYIYMYTRIVLLLLFLLLVFSLLPSRGRSHGLDFMCVMP